MVNIRAPAGPKPAVAPPPVQLNGGAAAPSVRSSDHDAGNTDASRPLKYKPCYVSFNKIHDLKLQSPVQRDALVFTVQLHAEHALVKNAATNWGGSIDRYNAAVSLMGSATAGLGIECPRVPRMLFTNECTAQAAVIAHQAASEVASSFARAYDITLDDWATPAQQIHSDCEINLKQWADLCGDEPCVTWRELLVRPAPGQPATAILGLSGRRCTVALYFANSFVAQIVAATLLCWSTMKYSLSDALKTKHDQIALINGQQPAAASNNKDGWTVVRDKKYALNQSTKKFSNLVDDINKGMPVALKWLTSNYGIALSCSSTKVTFLKERHSSIILSDFDATFDTCNLASSRLLSMLIKANVCNMQGELATDCAVTLKNDIRRAAASVILILPESKVAPLLSSISGCSAVSSVKEAKNKASITIKLPVGEPQAREPQAPEPSRSSSLNQPVASYIGVSSYAAMVARQAIKKQDAAKQQLGSSSAAKTKLNSNNANQPSTASTNQSVDQHDTDRSSGKKRASSDQSINHRPRKHVNNVFEAELAEMRQTMKLLLEENKKMKNELIELRTRHSVTDTDVSSSESELMHEDHQSNLELSLSSPSNHSINHSLDQSVKDRAQPKRSIDYRLNSLEDNVKELKNDVSNFMLSMERQLNGFFARAAGTTLDGSSSSKRARVDKNGSGPPPAIGAISINGQ
jgi:hypothetical protein